MNTTRHRLTLLLGTNPAEPHSTTRMRYAITMVAGFATAVQVIVWLMVAIFGTHLDGPWWLWTPASALAINAALLGLDHVRRHWSNTAAPTGTTRGSL
ncbi:hypothetical protein AB0I55_30325 [Actinocatenispora sera]|nr:hypothetical protein [Actinocatenispora sera]